MVLPSSCLIPWSSTRPFTEIIFFLKHAYWWKKCVLRSSCLSQLARALRTQVNYVLIIGGASLGPKCPPWICKFYTRWTVFLTRFITVSEGCPSHSSIKLRHWYLCHQWATYMEGQVFFNWFDPIRSLKSCRKRSTSRPLLPKAKVIWSCSIYVLMSESAKLYH